MEARRLTVTRTARYYVLGDVDGGWEELWFALHGYGQLAGRFLREFDGLAGPGRLLVAPEGLSRFYLRGTRGRVGASWMTREERADEVADQVVYLDTLRDVLEGQRDRHRGPWRTGVVGFSQGTATAGRWALRGARPLERVVLWGGGFPEDLHGAVEGATRGLEALSIALVTGEADEHTPRERSSAEAHGLRAAGARVEELWHPGGHHLDVRVLAAALRFPR